MLKFQIMAEHLDYTTGQKRVAKKEQQEIAWGNTEPTINKMKELYTCLTFSTGWSTRHNT